MKQIEQRAELMMAPKVSSNWRPMLGVGTGVIVLTFVVLGGWSAFARLDGGVVANGAISVESNRKTIQHLEGGIVREILVRDGDLVREGQPLLRLDPTQKEAVSRTYRQQLAIAMALEARLLAQRDMQDTVVFPPDVMKLKDDPLIGIAINDNRRQFESRRSGLVATTEVLEKQINQAKKDLDQSLVDQKRSADQLASINVELPNLRALLAKGLVALPRVTTLEREQMQRIGENETAKVNHSRAKEKIAELESRIAQARSDYRQEAATALPDVRKTLSDVGQQIVIANDTLRRINIDAPVAGAVQQMRVFTIGGVIKPGDPILDLVPVSDTLVVRAKVSPYDVDRVLPGAKVEIRLPQFVRFQNQVIWGAVRTVSHDALMDEIIRQPYFATEITVDRATIPKDIESKLTAGMNVETIIFYEGRTALQYFVSPILNRLAISMRER